MKKNRFSAALAALALVGLMLSPSIGWAASSYWVLNVIDADYNTPISSPTCEVYAAGTRSTTASTATNSTNYTVYSDAALATSKTNPMSQETVAGGIPAGTFKFYTASTVTSLDVVCYTTGGLYTWRNGVTVNDHTIKMDSSPETYHWRFPYSQNASETDSGIDLPYNLIIDDVFIETKSVVASGTIDVGLLSTETFGDADGFCDAVPTSAGATAGSGIGMKVGRSCSAGSTAGDLLSGVWANQLDTNNANKAQKFVIHHGSAVSVTYTTSAHASTGYVHILGHRLN